MSGHERRHLRHLRTARDAAQTLANDIDPDSPLAALARENAELLRRLVRDAELILVNRAPEGGLLLPN
jgi:hypothetical protein